MKYVAATFLFVHGFAHLVGFVGAFGLMRDVPHQTTVLGGSVHLGELGIRAVGSLWGVVALAFGAVALGLLQRATWTTPLLLSTTSVSLVLCAITLPEAKIGLALDILILVAWMTVGRMHLLAEPQ